MILCFNINLKCKDLDELILNECYKNKIHISNLKNFIRKFKEFFIQIKNSKLNIII